MLAATWTLPLDIPVTVVAGADAEDPRIGLLDRPNGTWIYRVESGRLLAFLPPLDLTRDLTPLGGRPLERASADVDWPECLRPEPGWPIECSSDPTGPVAVADLDGDGPAEIVVSLEDGRVAALSLDGQELRGWPAPLEPSLRDAPMLWDLDQDGAPEVFAVTTAGWLHRLEPDGAESPGWPVRVQVGEDESLWSSPVAAVLEPGEDASIVLVGTRGTVHVLDPTGSPRRGWPASAPPARPIFNPTSCFASPGVVDLNRDGRSEIAVGTNGGVLFVRSKAGETARGWPRMLLAQRRLGFGRPQARDLDGDGRIELVLASDRGFPGSAQIAVFSSDGDLVSGWPIDIEAAANDGVALVDLDGRPGLELVTSTLGGDGAIHVFDANGVAVPGWPRLFPRTSFDSGVVIADIDGRTGLEILALGTLTEYGTGAWLHALHADGSAVMGFPVEFSDCFAYGGGLTVADLDADGRSELILALVGRPQVVVLRTLGRADEAPWPRSGRGLDSVPGAAGLPSGPRATPAIGPVNDEVETADLGDRLHHSLDPMRTMSFVLRRGTPVRLDVLDLRGVRVRRLLDGPMPAGLYAISWEGDTDDGRALPSGAYFFQLEVEGRVEARQNITLVR